MSCARAGCIVIIGANPEAYLTFFKSSPRISSLNNPVSTILPLFCTIPAKDVLDVKTMLTISGLTLHLSAI